MTVNELFHNYLEGSRTKELEKQLLERLRVVTLQEVRKRSRGFRLAREDIDDVLQEVFFLLFEVLQQEEIKDFEREFVLAIRRHLRRTFKYKKRETLSGDYEIFEDCYSISPDLESYSNVITKLSSSQKEEEILTFLVANRIKEQTCTLEKAAEINNVSLNKIFKLEHKLKLAIKKYEEN